MLNNDSEILKKQFWGYAWTYAFSYLSGTISGVVDGVFASRFMSASDLAAFGLCSPFFSILAMIGGIFAFGLQHECTKKLSNGDEKGSNKAFSLVIELALVISVVLIMMGLMLMRRLCGVLGAEGINQFLAAGVRSYTIGFIPGIPIMLLCTIIPVVMNISGGKKYVVRGTLVQSITDIVLDYLFICVFDWGLTGLAIASSAAALGSLSVMLYFLIFKQKMFRLNFVAPTKVLLISVTKGGLPNFVRKLSAIVSVVVVNRIILSCGSDYMAAKSIVSSAATFFSAGMVGICSSMFLMAQIFFQEKNVGRVRWLVRKTLASIFLTGIPTVIILILFAPYIMKLFGADSEVYDCAVTGFKLYVYSIIFIGLTDALFKYLQAAGRFAHANIYAVLSKIALIIVAFPMTARFGSTGMWLSFTVAEVLILAVYLVECLVGSIYGKNSFTQVTLQLSDELEQLRLNSVEFTISKEDDVSKSSAFVWNYLQSHNTDKRKTYFSSLCVEEMARIFLEEVEHCGGNHKCMVFLLCEEDRILIRFRDDCQLFDLCQQYELIKSSSNSMENIGIRLLFSIAENVEYTSIMNLNNVMIRI